MSEHEKCVGESDEWYTPKSIFDAIGLTFDLDPCSPSKEHWTPAKKFYTKEDDGLLSEWQGLVWMNPPFGGRNGQVPWLRKFISHGNGIALVAARTSSGWFHEIAPQMDGMLFPKGKTKFVKPDGTIGKSPGTGVVLFSLGQVASNALKNSGLGIYLDIK
jgi:phage N-6-adenine-methyltransferase